MTAKCIGQSMPPVALSRKNSLFAGRNEGAEHWAAVASLIGTCKLNGVKPQRCFTDLLTRLVNGWPRARIDELVPRAGPTQQRLTVNPRPSGSRTFAYNQPGGSS